MEEWKQQLQALMSGERDEIVVPKEAFLDVRNMLVEENLLTQVRGIAKHGGITVYRRNTSSNETEQ